ncbi:MAG: hypothetical protein VW518_00330 [Burkholderiaceae bacterium]
MLKALTASALGCILLSSCATKVQRIEVIGTPVEKPKLTLPQADELRNLPVEWIVITPENFENQVAKLEGRPVVFFALTDEGYANLGLNISSIRAYIQQQQAIILAYQNYYTSANETIEKANKEIAETAAEGNAEPEEKSWLPWKRK